MSILISQLRLTCRDRGVVAATVRWLADTGERRRAKAYNFAALANLLGASAKVIGAGIWTKQESSEKESSQRQEQNV